MSENVEPFDGKYIRVGMVVRSRDGRRYIIEDEVKHPFIAVDLDTEERKFFSRKGRDRYRKPGGGGDIVSLINCLVPYKFEPGDFYTTKSGDTVMITEVRSVDGDFFVHAISTTNSTRKVYNLLGVLDIDNPSGWDIVCKAFE